MGDQGHAQHIRRVLADLVDGFRQLHAACLATAAGVDLGLDDPRLATEPVRRQHRVLHGEARESPGRRNTEFAQYFLCLIFMDVHAPPP